MIVGMTKFTSQMHFLINSVILPPCLFSYEPDAFRHLWTGGTCQVHVRTRIKQFIMQWQIWKILLTICKTNWNVIIPQNIYSNPLNAFSVWCFSANSSPSGWNCITVPFWELYWTLNAFILNSWNCMNYSTAYIQIEWATKGKGRTVYLVSENVEVTHKSLCSTTRLILASISSHSQHHICLSEPAAVTGHLSVVAACFFVLSTFNLTSQTDLPLLRFFFLFFFFLSTPQVHF